MELTQSVAFNYPVLMVSSVDHITGKTGLTLDILLSKAGGPFAAIAPTVIERGFGEYVLVLPTAAVDTLGAFSLHITGAGADPFDSLDQVVAAPPELVPPGGTVAPIANLKVLLGIAIGDTSQDVRLITLLRYAIAVVEGSTRCYFGTPKTRVEYHTGGTETIMLDGHIDDSVEADNPVPALDPTTSLVIDRRPRLLRSGAVWERLVEGEDWERRDQEIGFLQLWTVWPCDDEFRFTYLDGYADAPADIKELIVEIAMNQYLLDRNTAQGGGGIKSETLGDFSYTLDLTAFGSGGSNKLSDAGQQTIQRYKRRFA